ncbi:cation:proton antiporter [Planococcus halotolerans]|uniref:Sodium:proton antiporter n=1 Tax=Planococcus halotolerans TaxID=2233542 RepID=A0A365L616_9BACL|nr:sodium:proton antiporter [Planococcus halotolerans]QHJ70418.1 sodium:proton antiporter [Planococcus halotolerans]RAZ80856.1 sodium:proton antiporter [Planococcus halotolerans]
MLIIFLGVISQWLAWAFRLPAIVLMSIAGLIVGPILGIIHPEESFGELFNPVISLAVAIILFEGSLNLNFKEIRGFNKPVWRIVTFGAFIAWICGSLAAHYIAGLSWAVAFVIGGLFIVTGPTVILPLLRQAKLKARPAAILKWEGIIVDPFGALLALFAFQFVLFAIGDETAAAFGLFFLASLFAVALGAGVGWLLGWMFEKGQVPEFLKAPIVFGVVLLTFVLSDIVMHETGLLAVTAMGMVMANMHIASINDMRHFKENISVLLISSIFVMLTASLSMDVLIEIFNWRIIAFVLATLFVVRPLSIWLSTIGTDLTTKEKTLIGWIAPRGIVALTVSGYFAGVLLDAGFEDAELLTALTFALVFSTVVAHGFTIGWLGRKLGLATGDDPGIIIVGVGRFVLKLSEALSEYNKNLLIMDPSWGRLQPARLAGLKTFTGEILSEHTEYELDMTPYETMILAGEIDSYNALVMNNYVPEFGRENLYKTAIHQGDPADYHSSLKGRTLFGNEWNIHELDRKVEEGYTIRKTQLTEQYSYEDYKKKWSADTILLFVYREQGKIEFFTSDNFPEPKLGDTVVSFTSPARQSDRIQERLENKRAKNNPPQPKE